MKDKILKKLGYQAISGSSSNEIKRKEASLRRSRAILRSILTKNEGKKKKFKGSRGYLRVVPVETRDGKGFNW